MHALGRRVLPSKLHGMHLGTLSIVRRHSKMTHPTLRSTISHSTPAGNRPANCARSTPASVCPRLLQDPFRISWFEVYQLL